MLTADPRKLAKGRIFNITNTPLSKNKLQIFLRSEEHTSEHQSQSNLVCRLLLEKKKEISLICSSMLGTCSSSPAALRMSGTAPLMWSATVTLLAPGDCCALLHQLAFQTSSVMGS